MPNRFTAILALAMGCITLFGCGDSSSSSDISSMGTLFVAAQADSSVSRFQVQANGQLTAQGPKAVTGSAPASMAIAPTGEFAFVANSQCVNGNQNCNSISRYTIGVDGALTQLVGPQGVGLNPVALALNPAGSLLFVANRDSNTVSVFSIQLNGAQIGSTLPDGTLTQVSGSPFLAGTGPVALAVAPAGNFLYVVNGVSNDISAFSISSKGVLTPVLGSPFAGTNAVVPAGIGIAPSGNFVYVSNFGSNNVSAFTACTNVNLITSTCPIADGRLVEISSSPFVADLGPGPMAITPRGSYLYVADTSSDQISIFFVDINSGTLKPTLPPTMPTGPGPVALSIHPTGQWLYTANYSAGTVSVFGLSGETGLLTAQGTVTTRGQPAALAIR